MQEVLHQCFSFLAPKYVPFCLFHLFIPVCKSSLLVLAVKGWLCVIHWHLSMSQSSFQCFWYHATEPLNLKQFNSPSWLAVLISMLLSYATFSAENKKTEGKSDPTEKYLILIPSSNLPTSCIQCTGTVEDTTLWPVQAFDSTLPPEEIRSNHNLVQQDLQN